MGGLLSGSLIVSLLFLSHWHAQPLPRSAFFPFWFLLFIVTSFFASILITCPFISHVHQTGLFNSSSVWHHQFHGLYHSLPSSVSLTVCFCPCLLLLLQLLVCNRGASNPLCFLCLWLSRKPRRRRNQIVCQRLIPPDIHFSTSAWLLLPPILEAGEGEGADGGGRRRRLRMYRQPGSRGERVRIKEKVCVCVWGGAVGWGQIPAACASCQIDRVSARSSDLTSAWIYNTHTHLHTDTYSGRRSLGVWTSTQSQTDGIRLLQQQREERMLNIVTCGAAIELIDSIIFQ